MKIVIALAALVLAIDPAAGQSAENVLVIVNRASPISQQIGEYYAARRDVPEENLCRVKAPAGERIDRRFYEVFEKKVAQCIKRLPDAARIQYLVTTKGVPLLVHGVPGAKESHAAVDSELALLYQKIRGEEFPLEGWVRNPFFGKYLSAFDQADHPIYLVTRLTGYSFDDVRGLIDRAQQAKNRGWFVLDSSPRTNKQGNQWLETAARALPLDRVRLEREATVVYEARGVIGYAGWGSNDKQRLADQRRWLEFEWLPGAIATEYVSTNARTFEEPHDSWRPGDWGERTLYLAGSPQSMTGDLIREGVTGVAGHVAEPFLTGSPRPNYLLPAYYEGRTLAESFYLSIPFLSWRNVVIGDPLCRLGPPSAER